MLYLIADALAFRASSTCSATSFRAGGAVATALFIGLLIGPAFSAGCGTPARPADPRGWARPVISLPEGHPTMGGLMILTSLSVAMLLGCGRLGVHLGCLFVTLGFGAIGLATTMTK